MGAQFGMGLLEEHSEASLNRDIASQEYGATMSAINSLEKQKEVLGSIYENLKKPVVDRFGNALLKTTISENALNKKANMAYSGTVSQAVGLQRENVKDSFESQIMNMEMNQANAEGAVETQIQSLKGKAEVYKLRSNYYTPTESFFKSIGDLIGL